jgi:hypothetical protein
MRPASLPRPARALVLGLLALALLTAACSPEATRARSGGPGADVGNRNPIVELHGTTDMYYHTPRVGQPAQP